MCNPPLPSEYAYNGCQQENAGLVLGTEEYETMVHWVRDRLQKCHWVPSDTGTKSRSRNRGQQHIYTQSSSRIDSVAVLVE